MIDKLFVKYHGRLVGTLAIAKTNEIFFQYDDSWIQDGFSLNPFKLPLNKNLFKATSPYFGGLFGVFADSLPDNYGHLIIDRYLTRTGIELSSLNPLDKLSIIGENGMGALTYEPASFEAWDRSRYDLDSLQEDVTELLESREIKDIDSLFRLGGSSGGSRPKALVTMDGEEYLVKFLSRLDPPDIAQNEFDYMNLARSVGIDVPECRLVETPKGNRLFAIKRFDRDGERRIHMVSAAGLLEFDFWVPSLDYNDLLKLTEILTRNKKDVIEMYRRMVFNVVFENLDDHGKNFSFLYDEKRRMYVLAPAYDLTKSMTYYGEHTTSVNGKGKDITDEDMLAVAKKANLDLRIAKDIIQTIRQAYEEYHSKPSVE